jgi:hypothetical protein
MNTQSQHVAYLWMDDAQIRALLEVLLPGSTVGTSDTIKANIVDILHNFSRFTSARADLVRGDAISVLMRFLLQTSSTEWDTDIVLHGVAETLNNISQETKHAAALVNGGAVPELLKALQTSTVRLCVKAGAAQMLSNISKISEHINDLVEDDAISVVIQACLPVQTNSRVETVMLITTLDNIFKQAWHRKANLEDIEGIRQIAQDIFSFSHMDSQIRILVAILIGIMRHYSGGRHTLIGIMRHSGRHTSTVDFTDVSSIRRKAATSALLKLAKFKSSYRQMMKEANVTAEDIGWGGIFSPVF